MESNIVIFSDLEKITKEKYVNTTTITFTKLEIQGLSATLRKKSRKKRRHPVNIVSTHTQ